MIDLYPSLRICPPLVTAALLAPLVWAVGGCGSSSHVRVTDGVDTVDEVFERKCLHEESGQVLEPLVLHWDGRLQGKLRDQADRGLVAFRYDGCEVKPVLSCEIPGGYALKEQTVQVRQEIFEHSSEFNVGFPLLFNAFHTHMGGGRKLEVNFLTASVHQANLSRVTVDHLGSGCEGVTHVLSSAYLGAYEISSESRQSAGVGANAGPVGVGTEQSFRRKSVNAGGLFEACRRGERASTDRNCQAHVRVTLKPIAPGFRTAASSAPSSSKGSSSSSSSGPSDQGPSSDIGHLIELGVHVASAVGVDVVGTVAENVSEFGAEQLAQLAGELGRLELNEGLGPALAHAQAVYSKIQSLPGADRLQAEIQRLAALSGLEQTLQKLVLSAQQGTLSTEELQSAQEEMKAMERAHPGEPAVRDARARLEIQQALQEAELARRTGRKAQALRILAAAHLQAPGDPSLLEAMGQIDGFERRKICDLEPVGRGAFVSLKTAPDGGEADRLYEGATLAVVQSQDPWTEVIVLSGARRATSGFVASRWTCPAVD